MNNDAPLVGLVLPCYNEEEIISHSYQIVNEYLKGLIEEKKISSGSFLVFIDDGSRDNTFNLLQSFAGGHVKVIKLSRNFGHQNALLAGMSIYHSQADCLITMDADLQDDITVIEQMIQLYQNGDQIVYGTRRKREKDSFIKKTTAILFYKLMHLMGIDVIFNHADYRLASKVVLSELQRFEEVNLFLRGIFPSLGFKYGVVYYDRKERTAGDSKFPFFKMFSFAMDGITSFSVKPLRMVTFIGFIVFTGSIILSVFTIISYFFYDVVHGWASIALPIYFIGGIQLLSLGIVGEYIGKIYKEVKRRPRYIIEKII